MSQQTFLISQDVSKISSRRLQRNNFSSSKTSSRPLQDVFAIRLPKTSSKRLQDVIKISLQDVLKTSLKRICKTPSSRRLQENVLQLCLEDIFKTSYKTKSFTLKTSSRCFQDVFKTSSVRLHQDEYLLGWFFPPM